MHAQGLAPLGQIALLCTAWPRARSIDLPLIVYFFTIENEYR